MHNVLIHTMFAVSLIPLLFSDGASAHEPMCGDGVVLVYDKEPTGLGDGSKGGSAVSFVLGPKLTMVQRADSTDVVDYEGLRLFRYSADTKNCDTYRLADYVPGDGKTGVESADTAVLREKAGLIGSYRTQKAERTEFVAGKRAVRKLLEWGAEANRYRTAGAVSVEMYGQVFEPETEEYLTSSAIERIDDLFCCAAEREPVFQANPLLRRLDIAGILGVLQGVPLEILSGDGSVSRFREIRSTGRLSLEQVLPPACK